MRKGGKVRTAHAVRIIARGPNPHPVRKLSSSNLSKIMQLRFPNQSAVHPAIHVHMTGFFIMYYFWCLLLLILK